MVLTIMTQKKGMEIDDSENLKEEQKASKLACLEKDTQQQRSITDEPWDYGYTINIGS